MKGFCVFGIAIASLVAQGAAAPNPQQQQSTAAIPCRWIVTLKLGIDKSDVKQHLDWIHDTHRRSLSRRQTTGIERTFGIGNFHGYTGEFDQQLLAEIEAKDEVIAIEPDHEAALTALTEVSDQPWGLASLSSRSKLISADVDHQSYVYDTSAGTGTFAYVLDTGIRISHPDFQGRAIKGTNVFPEVAHDDDFGHGTHVAGIIGSLRFGVAKNATIVDVKTTRVAYSTTAKIIEALEWSVQNITDTPGRVGKSVISISLATATSTALNDAVDAATSLGVFVVVGAGNDGKDASTRSPASAPTAFTVGAIDINSTRATWSNYGPSVDVFAAGVDVRSTSLYQDGTELLSGTSMSTPHISGLALYLKGLEGSAVDAPAAIGARIKELATKDVVTDAGVGSPNLVAYNGNGRR
ncbi:Suppressor of the cold-sensitive snRNP biogenesis mutant brr1-1 [Colletotrichum fioriniae]|uniref:Suppressor of the cold-sensitive snRNP biogenesis mutant brr1-1 n=1 Tax=Colletotrichum fioriniae TaxID=710243 RepID=UPI0032DB9A84|nr:Suppressor of the cold-sensitive snRNP biogenesis mutant brr1-1 [Colletotrichum fioriniae]